MVAVVVGGRGDGAKGETDNAGGHGCLSTWSEAAESEKGKDKRI